ncbi:WD repeat-containing protein 44-like [Brachyhypopomus gauderio]|uniref:WD repeat-containing protein 44-like n=1 Tax=Brachyhypopomus gauderio TaxID=698409 RepID=UPI004042F276
MASDTSDAEEFYDAAEDVNFSPSPKVSPAKFILPQPKGLDEAQDVAAGLAPSEPRHDDSVQIIDSIIEESQKDSGVEEEFLRREDARPPDRMCGTEDEASAAPNLPASPPDDAAPELLRLRDVVLRDVPEAAPDVADGTPAAQDGSPAASPPPPDITSALGAPPPPDELAACAPAGSDVPPTADILEQVPLADKLAELDTSGPSKPPRQFTVEPDIVASTKKTPPSRPPPPGGAPPRRPPPPTRPAVPPGTKSQEVKRPTGLDVSAEVVEDPCGLVSPNSTVRCLTKELQHSLDLASATSGDKVVTAQENDDPASSPGIETPGPQRPRSNSGRELTDEVCVPEEYSCSPGHVCSDVSSAEEYSCSPGHVCSDVSSAEEYYLFSWSPEEYSCSPGHVCSDVSSAEEYSCSPGHVCSDVSSAEEYSCSPLVTCAAMSPELREYSCSPGHMMSLS